MTITCRDNHLLEGNSELTCNGYNGWSSDPPKCTRKGNIMIYVSFFVTMQWSVIATKSTPMLRSHDLTFSIAVCTGFTVEGSNQGSLSDTNAGDTVTVSCLKKHVLIGSSSLTCTIDGSWSSSSPECKRLSKLGSTCPKGYPLEGKRGTDLNGQWCKTESLLQNRAFCRGSGKEMFNSLPSTLGKNSQLGSLVFSIPVTGKLKV